MKSYSLLDTIGNTPMVELKNMSPKKGVRIFAKLEGQNPTGSVKDRIAKSMIEKAEREGFLDSTVTILEPTSGNTGISLAFVAGLKGYSVTAVMPDNASVERAQLLRAYGAQIIFSEGKYGSNGAIALAEEIVRGDAGKGYYMPYQYGNHANPDAHYQSTGMEIARDLPEVDVFVAGLGTGGTLMGVGRRLKEHRKDVKIIAVAPEPDEAIQGLRDLEEGFIPPILDISLLDARIMAKTADAFTGTKELLRQEGIFAGISAGSVIWAAMKIASKLESGNIVCLFADGGWKYLSSGIWTKDPGQLEEVARGKIWW
jgi:cysteine synthase